VFRGKQFRITAETLAIQEIDGKRIAVKIPADAVIRVTGGPTPGDSRMIDVEWNGNPLVMFAEDVRRRGEEVKGETA
jgi:hypothetical protein